MRGANALLPGQGFAVERLLAPEQALIAYFSRVRLAPPRDERVALDAAYGRILATRVDADTDYPSGPRSTMDGFAVASRETPGTLRIAGTIAMGAQWSDALRAGCTLRIPTGGLLPPGADAVVAIEDARAEGDEVVVASAIPAGDCVTPRGSDMRAGESVFEAGRIIGAAELGVLATLGVTAVPVFAQPLVTVISSGDELVETAQRPGPAQVRDSNRWALDGALRALGARPRHVPIVRDDPDALRDALREGLACSDAVVLTGGSSVGERDYTPRVVDALGEPGVIVHGLRVKPGKPTVLAAVGGKPVIGLPGNPTSALMILEAVAAPVIAALTGATRRTVVLDAVLGEAYEKRPGWTWYVPVALRDGNDGRRTASPLPMRSAYVSLLARASGFVVMDETVSVQPAGSPVRVVRFLGAA